MVHCHYNVNYESLRAPTQETPQDFEKLVLGPLSPCRTEPKWSRKPDFTALLKSDVHLLKHLLYIC